MIKKILIVVFVLLFSAGVWFWWVCIRERPIVDKNVIGWCDGGDHIKIVNEQSATIITSVSSTKINDTLAIEVRETTVLNPFKPKSMDTGAYIVKLDPDVKYVRFGGAVKPIEALNECIVTTTQLK